MKLSRLTPIVFIVWLVFYMFGNNMLPVTDPVESNYALTAPKISLGRRTTQSAVPKILKPRAISQ